MSHRYSGRAGTGTQVWLAPKCSHCTDHTFFQGKGHNSLSRQEYNPDLWILIEENALFHFKVGIDFSLMGYSSSILFSENVIVNSDGPAFTKTYQTLSIWRDTLRAIRLTHFSRFSKPHSWRTISSKPKQLGR